MGDPDTLTDFINYASQTFPARHYGLVLWNHGAGPIGGYGSDSYFEGDSLLLPELRQAVSTSVRERRALTLFPLMPASWEGWRQRPAWRE